MITEKNIYLRGDDICNFDPDYQFKIYLGIDNNEDNILGILLWDISHLYCYVSGYSLVWIFYVRHKLYGKWICANIYKSGALDSIVHIPIQERFSTDSSLYIWMYRDLIMYTMRIYSVCNGMNENYL